MTNTQRTDEQPWTCRGCGVPISLDKGMNDVLSHKCHTPTDDSVVEKWENEYAEVFRLTCTHPVSNDFLKRNTIKFIRSLLTSQSIKHKAEVEKAVREERIRFARVMINTSIIDEEEVTEEDFEGVSKMDAFMAGVTHMQKAFNSTLNT